MKQKPYKGYLVLLRGTILSFLGESPHFLELGAFIAIVIECDWDRNHPNYACLTKTNAELAVRWGCDPSTIWRYKKQLLKMGLLVRHGNLYRVKNFEWFEVPLVKKLAKTPLSTLQELVAKSQEVVADMQKDIAGLQDHQGENSDQNFSVSSKGNLGLSKDNDRVITDEEIEQHLKDFGDAEK